MKRMLLVAVFMVSFYCLMGWSETSTYTYNFPKPPAEWGQAISFGNLSPGFFQVLYQNKTGVVRIATYGIVGASMDNLKDPQLMMVFAFDQKAAVGSKINEGKLVSGIR